MTLGTVFCCSYYHRSALPILFSFSLKTFAQREQLEEEEEEEARESRVLGSFRGLNCTISCSRTLHQSPSEPRFSPFLGKGQALEAVSGPAGNDICVWLFTMASEFLELSLDSRILEERRTSSSSGACMDGRDAMAMSGPAYYIAHRGIPGSLAGSQPGLHAAAQPGVRSLPNPGTILVVPSSGVGSAAFQVESPPTASLHGGGGGLGEGASQTEPVKRKRGRPRKYGPDGSVALALSPISSSAPSSATVVGSETASGAPTPKRGRGRPPGTGRKQQLASLGEWVVGSAGMGFTPHVITIAIGEDIAAKIMSFSQQGPRAVCILSANGAVSTVTLRQSATSGGTVTYEGRFEILCLSGSYMLTDNGNGSRSRTGGLSISLSSPDGRVIGGGVAGLLIAATPVQVIVGSFIYAGSKARSKQKASNETGAQSSELQVGDEQSAPYAAIPDQNVTPSSVMGGWPGSRQLDMRNAHIDIDLTRG